MFDWKYLSINARIALCLVLAEKNLDKSKRLLYLFLFGDKSIVGGL